METPLERLERALAVIARDVDADGLCDAVVAAALDVAEADSSAVFLRDANERELELRASLGFEPALARAWRLPLDPSLRAFAPPVSGPALLVPLRVDGRVVGALLTSRREGRAAFPGEHASAWRALAHATESALAGAILLANARAAEEELAAVTTAAPDPILRVTPDARVLFANPAAGALIEREGAEALTRALVAANSDEVTLEDGTVLGVRSAGADDGYPGTVYVLRDLTDARRRDAILRQSEKLAAMGTLLAQVAHEVGNPLTFLKTNTETLRLTSKDERAQRLLAANAEGIRRIESLVASLKTLAKPGPSEFRRVSVNEVIETTAAVVRPRFKHRVALELSLADVPRIDGSFQSLGQVFLNLLLNASDALGEPGGVVSIATSAEHASVVAVVRDSGPGIPPDVFPRLFRAFETTKESGTGLGLSISRDIVAAHHGTIEARNAEGGGAEFTIRLPSAAQAATAQAASSS